ncbi:putative Serpin family protein [Medicago truncatula]|uniref:Putative Serpin family protein n=1 Tax=Medicago truncatula TaxID=3880 RepID=A0A072V1U8_MEDTR|nr:serpin-ZXA [Medicago truncatula]KEH35797.1 serpin-like protein [Medicago truncatula]RHN70357.1 putative Serpin family protein [Medicago truncatula]
MANGSSIKVPFMTNMKDQFISVFHDFKVLRLSYRQGEDKRHFSMYIFLPNAKDGLTDLVENMASKFELLEHNLPVIQKKVRNFKIPRFKFSIWLETSDMLKELGVILPFSLGGLTKMMDFLAGQNLFVSNIFQKYFIEVNEKGTKVASASAAVVTLCMCMGDCLLKNLYPTIETN